MSLKSFSSRPKTVAEIVDQAQKYDYNAMIPLRYWLRSIDALLKEAYIYEREGNDQQAYLLLFRHAAIVLGNLTSHPEAKHYKAELQAAQSLVKKNLAKLEVLKPRIEARYTRYQEAQKRRQAQVEEQRRQRGASYDLAEDLSKTSIRPKTPNDEAEYGGSQHLNAGENRDLAVRLAQREIRKRDTARRSTRQAGLTDAQERERRTGGVWGDWESELGRDRQQDTHDLSQDMIRARRQLDHPGERRDSRTDRYDSAAEHIRYSYPTVPHKSQAPSVTTAQREPLPPHPPKLPYRPEQLPPRPPPKDLRHEAPPSYTTSLAELAPPLPAKASLSDSSDPISRSASTSPPSDLKPSDFTFKPSAYLENGTPLRSIFLPSDLRRHFLRIAEPNTRRNLETCGVLCGTLISNALFISKLVIPEQESTSDTCETTNEGALFDYCDKEDVMVLGWIHTHPTQTCFMSSRDVHTHAGYQVMMPEAIAIVCAPSKDPSSGIFRLTDPPGMQTVLSCTQTGVFHPHSVDNIYTDALRPGHVHEGAGLPLEIVDLRPGH